MTSTSSPIWFAGTAAFPSEEPMQGRIVALHGRKFGAIGLSMYKKSHSNNNIHWIAAIQRASAGHGFSAAEPRLASGNRGSRLLSAFPSVLPSGLQVVYSCQHPATAGIRRPIPLALLFPQPQDPSTSPLKLSCVRVYHPQCGPSSERRAASGPPSHPPPPPLPSSSRGNNGRAQYQPTSPS